ncbi:DUF4345 family protein [Phenylobacterium sp.]|uniref:DUF4345 family protein n=1 Tax=Phenylobacterium sp. TaxID=1871053 RepID=UPI002F9534C9
MSPALERRLLQLAIAVGGIVPVYGGLMGALGRMSDNSHFRYLSGLLLGIGLTFWAMVPTVERRGATFRPLAAIVVMGGLARLAAVVQQGGDAGDYFPLSMEIAVTPLLALWRERVERRSAVSA